ncbi:MAG: hypothetical protein ABII90_12650 [Bacteroidota bacterium]
MPKEKIKSIQFRLLKVKTTDFKLSHPRKKYDAKKEATVKFSVEPLINAIIQNDGKYILGIRIHCSIIETGELFCEITTQFKFLIINFKKQLTKTQGGYYADIGLVSILLAISLSTTRGILIEKSYNTILQKECLPIMNPSAFFSEAAKKLPKKKQNK